MKDDVAPRILPTIAGSLCLSLGLLWLTDSILGLGLFRMDRMWPLFVLLPGLIFEYWHYGVAKTPGFLVPGGILTVIGALFFFETFTYWRYSAYTWPVYILAVAAGLAQLSAALGNPRGLVAVVALLGIVFAAAALSIAATLVFSVVPYKIVLPALLVGAGAWLLLGGGRGLRS